MHVLYEGLETHTKHDWDTKEDLYYIHEKKLTIIPNGKTKNAGWDESGRIETQPRQVGTTPKIIQRDKRELQYLQKVIVELNGRVNHENEENLLHMLAKR